MRPALANYAVFLRFAGRGICDSKDILGPCDTRNEREKVGKGCGDLLSLSLLAPTR